MQYYAINNITLTLLNIVDLMYFCSNMIAFYVSRGKFSRGFFLRFFFRGVFFLGRFFTAWYSSEGFISRE